MSIISITITETAEQIVAGVPKAVYITTNVPSSIFYTLDGTDPTVYSSIYIDKIVFLNVSSQITLKIIATDGVNYSPIITETYGSSLSQNTRYPHSTTDASPSQYSMHSLYPYGTYGPQPNTQYLNPAGITVNNPSLTQISNGYSASGEPTDFTNMPYTSENYYIKYSTTDAQGQRGHGIGTIPSEVVILEEPEPPQETFDYTALFDPRSFVVYQDVNNENPNDPPHINSQYFSLSNQEDPTSLYNSGLDSATTMGSFVRSEYNPRTGKMTYYYLDSHTCKWIISTFDYQPNGNFSGNLCGIFVSPQGGAGFVFTWEQYMRRSLF